MDALIYVSYFFGGAFLGNAIPHIVNGISGQPFQLHGGNSPTGRSN